MFFHLRVALMLSVFVVCFPARSALPVETPEALEIVTTEQDVRIEVSPLSFIDWKQEQVTQALNKVTRLSNKIRIMESDQFTIQPVQLTENREVVASEQVAQKSLKKVLVRHKQDLKLAQESLKYSEELTFEDYLIIYVRQYRDNDAIMKKIVALLTPEQQNQLLLMALGGKTTPVAAPEVSKKVPAVTELKSGLKRSTL